MRSGAIPAKAASRRAADSSYNPNSAFALPPAIAARSASLNDATEAICPIGSYSPMS